MKLSGRVEHRENRGHGILFGHHQPVHRRSHSPTPRCRRTRARRADRYDPRVGGWRSMRVSFEGVPSAVAVDEHGDQEDDRDDEIEVVRVEELDVQDVRDPRHDQQAEESRRWDCRPRPG